MSGRVVRALAVAVLPIALGVAFWRHALGTGAQTGFGDWQFFHHMWEVARVGLLRDGELPTWNPHHCGGLSYFGNPQSQAFSPLFPLALVLGTAWASKVFLVVHTALALLGAYRLGIVRLGVRPVAAATGAAVWAFSGFFAWHGGGGHAAFLPFAFAPWALLALRRAHTRPRAAAAVAAWVGLSLLEGGIYPTLLLAVLLSFDCVEALVRGLPMRTIGKIVGLAALLCLLASAVRALPIAVELARNPRPVLSLDALGAGEVLHALTARASAWRVEGHPFVWPEYGAYVGWGALGLAAFGMLVAWRRGHGEHIVALGLFVAFAMGDRGEWWPWPLLQKLPVYDSLRVPSRFLVFVTLEVALLAALGLDGILRRSAEAAGPIVRRTGAAIAVMGSLVLVGDLLHVNGTTADLFHRPPIEVPEEPGRFHLVGRAGYARGYASYPARELGTPACYEGLLVRPARGLWTGDRPQVRVRPRGAGEARELGRTRSAVTLTVDLDRPGRVLLNQNFDPDWVAEPGEVGSRRGLLAVSLPKGRHRVLAAHRPWTRWPGLLVSLVGWLAIAATLAWRRRERT